MIVAPAADAADFRCSNAVPAAPIEPTPPLDLDCGECRLCIDACPTGALDEPGTLDSTRCLSYWTQAPGPPPAEYRADLGPQVYGCDICQDVCPWNAGPARRRSDLSPDDDAWVSLADWLTLSDDELLDRHGHLYVPDRDPRYLRRNALVALGNEGGEEAAALAAPFADGDDALLRDAARRVLERS